MQIVFRTFTVVVTLLSYAWPLHAQDSPIAEPKTSFFTTPPLFSEQRAVSEEPERRDEIETDRDSFTPALSTAGNRRLIFESAWTIIDNRGYKETNSFPEALFRYGLGNRMELRMGFNFESGATHEEPAILEKESNVSYGIKFRITDAVTWLPASAFIVQAITPTSGLSTNTNLISTLVFGWELPGQMKLDAAFRHGMVTEVHDHFNEWAPSVVLKIPVVEKFNIHAEYFGIFTSNREELLNHQYFSPGVHYLVTENFEIGFRLGFGLNEQTPRFFSNIGLGLRF